MMLNTIEFILELVHEVLTDDMSVPPEPNVQQDISVNERQSWGRCYRALIQPHSS